jgi:hypothetical protein
MTLVFRKQPGGERGAVGRGEYELSGESRGYDAGSLNEVGFILETPFGPKETDLILSHQGGKRRLRRTVDDPDSMQIGRQAAALLLLPECTRVESATSKALPILLTKRYILDLHVELVVLDSGMALLTPTVAFARSGTETDENLVVRIPVRERFETIERILAEREKLPEQVRTPLDTIAAILQQTNTLKRPLEQAVKALQQALELVAFDYLPTSDPVPAIAHILGFGEAPQIPTPPETPSDDPVVRLRSENILRARRARGYSASVFRKNVQRAYKFRCLFCGSKWPPPQKGLAPGVDAAHILPWGEFDLDHVTNGIILCKQHHWAFDNHLLVLGYANNKYYVAIQLEDTVGYADDPTIKTELERVCGPVPLDHLPAKVAERPNPTFIEMLYA